MISFQQRQEDRAAVVLEDPLLRSKKCCVSVNGSMSVQPHANKTTASFLFILRLYRPSIYTACHEIFDIG